MTHDSTNGLYTVTITNVIDDSKIIFSNNGATQTNSLPLVDDAIYNKTTKIAAQTVPVNSYGKATFCSQYPLDFSTAEGLTAYIITAANKATGTLTTEAVTKVPANTGLYIEGAATSYTVTPTATASAINGNMLVGVTTDTPISQGNTNYILTVDGANGTISTPKFFMVNENGNTVTAGKAYLVVPDGARQSFWFDNEANSINGVAQESQFEGQAYNLAGQRVAQPTKGLYIVNGKKVIKK